MTDMSLPDVPLPAALHHNPHFLHAVAVLAARQDVRARVAVYTESGRQILAAGARVPGDLDALLAGERLATPLDQVLHTHLLVDVPTIETEIMMLASSHVLGGQLVKALDGRLPVLMEPLRFLSWPPTASFMLTVMRAQRPELYAHSILITMVALYLAACTEMPGQQAGQLAAAALLHDVGMLFLPASWDDPSHKLNLQERKQLTNHSLIAMMVARDCHTYSPAVEDAILEHHERMDGSGYPRSLTGGEISTMGQILMVSEVVAAFYGKYFDMPALRLSLVLRMNHARFPRDLVSHIYRMMGPPLPMLPTGHASVMSEVRHGIANLSAIFEHWGQSKRRMPARWQVLPGGRAGVFIDARLQALEKTLAEAGSHPRQQAGWLQMFEQEPASLTELLLINREAMWQLDGIISTCARRWPRVLAPTSAVDEITHRWVRACKSSYVAMGLPPLPEPDAQRR